MAKLPVDAPIGDVLRALTRLGFVIVRKGNHVSPVRKNADGTRTMLTLPNHRTLRSSTLRTILSQAGIPRDGFLEAYRG